MYGLGPPASVLLAPCGEADELARFRAPPVLAVLADMEEQPGGTGFKRMDEAVAPLLVPFGDLAQLHAAAFSAGG